MNLSKKHRLNIWLVVLLPSFVMILLVGLPVHTFAQKKMLSGSHGQSNVMPKSCRSCHMGMTMALSGEEAPCLRCHSGSSERSEMIQKGYLKELGGAVALNIVNDLQKPYSHPVLTVQGVHRQMENLPEDVVNAARHSECVDCHNPHVAEKQAPYRGLMGRRVGNLITEIEKEYELCYRCHSESANLPGTFSNKHAEFKETNPSFHPVEGEGKSTVVVSLMEPYVAQKKKPNDVSIISCSDCHGSDDSGGPKGPHGSNYPGLLKFRYDIDDEQPESKQTYALCYECHARDSILANESFPYHSLHIEGRMGGVDGTSCFTCHDAHGSTQYQHLIRFNTDVVTENQNGRLRYDAQGYSARHGSCYLSCHGVDHDPKEY